MEKINERGETSFAMVGALLGFSLGINAMNITYMIFDDSDDRVREVQVYNEQLRPQLEVGERVVAHLRVDDQDRHFTFDSKSAQGAEQACKGSFKIEQGTATLAGKLSCTETVNVGR